MPETTFTGVPVDQIFSRLAEPFDERAYRQVPGGANLTDINTGYMIERATQIFGPRGLGWGLEYGREDMEVTESGDRGRVTAHLKHAVFWYALKNEQGSLRRIDIVVSAANSNKAEYAEEGARTSAIGAGLKVLGFQNPLYKNIFDAATGEERPARRQNRAQQQTGNGNGHNGNGAQFTHNREGILAFATSIGGSSADISAVLDQLGRTGADRNITDANWTEVTNALRSRLQPQTTVA